MIRYALICDTGHEFESWFPTSASFEDQAKRGFVSCPSCNSSKVERAIMAPNVARTDRGGTPRTQPIEPQAQAADAAPTGAAQPPTQAPVALMGEKEIAFRQMLAALHQHVADNAENVGERFADEALKIHHGESDSRACRARGTDRR
jgi:hypothetical protein